MLAGQGSEGWDPSWERGVFQPWFRSATTTPDPAAQRAADPPIGSR